MNAKKIIKDWLKALGLALVTIMVAKAFLFEIFTIPSSSMEAALVPGDVILVNKMKYGIRIPFTPLSLPLTHQYLPFSNTKKSYSTLVQLPYWRFFESKIERNDVVVFNYPINEEHPVDHKDYYIKRCVGLPGDTLEINDQQLIINNRKLRVFPSVQFDYRVETNVTITSDSLNELGIIDNRVAGLKNLWEVTCTDSLAELLKKQPYIAKVERMAVPNGIYADYVFPYSEHYKHNIDNLGPIEIPKKGKTIQLSLENLPLYERIINVYEKNELVVDEDEIVINGEVTTEYTFQMDYYFMMGDNRYNSSDSRFWGFLPEDHVIGKAQSILFSIDKMEDKFRWDRMFEGVN